MSNETTKQALRRAMKQSGSLSQVIKVVTRDLWDEMEGVCVSLDIDTKQSLTPKTVIELAKTAGLTKTDKKGNVTICKVSKVIERVEVVTKDEQGNEFKVKVAKRDEKGDEVVRYELKTVKAWTPAILVEVLAQAQAVNEK